MNKTFNFALFAALSTTALAGCAGLLETVDLAAQAEELMAFEINLDAFVPAQLSADAYTDSADSTMSVDLHMNDHYEEDKAVGLQMTEFHGAYGDVKTAFTGLNQFYDNRGHMMDEMRHGNMFGRGNSYRNIINDIDYEVVVADGVSSLVANFDLGTYEVQRTTDEVTGDVLTWGSFTNPYGTVISFKTTNDDLLQVSIDRADDRADTYLAFSREGTTISSQLVRFKSDGVDIDVLGAGYAVFEEDYSYVGYNNANAVGIVRDYLEMEVYSTIDSTLIASHRQFTLLQSDYDLIVLPIVTLGDFVEGDIERVGRGAFSVKDVQFPTQADLLVGTADYAVVAEGRVRYTGRSEGILSRSVESLTLQITADEYALNGIPAPFVPSATNFEDILSNLDAFMTQYASWNSSLTLADVTFNLPTVAVDEEEAISSSTEEIVSSSEESIISSTSEEPAITSSSSEEITSGTGV